MSNHQNEVIAEHHHENCEGYTECCPGAAPVMWPEIPMCSDCKEWSIDVCEGCE